MLENVYHLICTVTRDCNLNCVYCFEEDKQRYQGEQMSRECFRAFLDRWATDRREHGISYDVDICFHGGEPTLVSRELLQDLIDTACQTLGRDKVSFGLQTNGSLLDQEWRNFCALNKIDVGVSLDGYNYAANQWRFGRQKKLFHQEVTRLKQNPWICSILAMLHKQNLRSMPFFLWYALWKYKVRAVKVNPLENVTSNSEQNLEINGAELAHKFYLPLLHWSLFFPFLLEPNIKDALNKFVWRYIGKVAEQNSPDRIRVLCNAKFCSAGLGIINLLPNGDIWGCQRSQELPQYRFGNIAEPPADIFGLKIYAKLFHLALPQARAVREKHCDTCFAADICNYGCRAFSLLKTKGATTLATEPLCAAYQILRRYFARHLSDMLLLCALVNDWSWRQTKTGIEIQYNDHHFYTVEKNRLSWPLRWRIRFSETVKTSRTVEKRR